MKKKYAVLIVDMLNEYVSENGKIYCDKAIEIIPVIQKLKKIIKDYGGKCVYVNTSHIGNDDPEIKKWGQHAMRGTWGAEVCEQLSMEEDDIEVYKRTYDGFYNTELEITLRSLHITDVIVVGIHTHVCVLQTALGAFYRGFNVIVLEDGMTTGYKPNHESRLRFFQTHVGTLTNLSEFCKELYDESTNSKDNSI